MNDDGDCLNYLINTKLSITSIRWPNLVRHHMSWQGFGMNKEVEMRPGNTTWWLDAVEYYMLWLMNTSLPIVLDLNSSFRVVWFRYIITSTFNDSDESS